MNAQSKPNTRIDIRLKNRYLPAVRAIVASFYKITDREYPWNRWIAYPYGSFERHGGIIPSDLVSKNLDDYSVLSGELETDDPNEIILDKIRPEIYRFFGESVSSIEVTKY
jgi:hypothetical protein